MKCLVFLGTVLLSICSTGVQAQSNLGFENWVTNQSIEEPANWQTNNSLNSTTVSKAGDAYYGNYAALIASDGLSFEGKAPGVLRTTWIGMGTPLKNVHLKMSIDSISGGASALLCFKGFANGSTLYNDSVEFTTVTNGWAAQEITMSDTLSVCDSVQVYLVAQSRATPTGYEGYCQFKVDDILINQSLSLGEGHRLDDQISIYPNPSDKRIYYNTLQDPRFSHILLLSSDGQEISRFTELDEGALDVSDISPGAYFLKFVSENAVFTKKVIIE